MPRSRPSPAQNRKSRKSRKRVPASAGRAKKPVKTRGRKAATFSGKAPPVKPSPRPEKSVSHNWGQDQEHIEQLLRSNYPKVFGPVETRDGSAEVSRSPSYRVSDLIREAPIAADVINKSIYEFEDGHHRLPAVVRDRMAVCMAKVWLDALYYEAYGQYINQSTKGRNLNERKRKKNGLDERDNMIRRQFGKLAKDLPGKGQRYEHLAREHGLDIRHVQRIINPKKD